MHKQILVLAVLLLPAIHSYAAGDMTAQTPVEVSVDLGDAQDHLRFYPAGLQFETGKLYKLVIRNPSRQKHYFISEGLSRSVFTRKVEVISHDGKTVAEVKGPVNEIEVYPGGTAEWWFVPVKTLAAGRAHCSIKGHAEAGMVGQVNIR